MRNESHGFTGFGAAFLLGGFSIIFGLIATTGSVIAIALSVGTLLGGMLLLRMDIAIWMVLVGTFLINGIVGLAFPGLTKAAWLFSMLGFFLLAGTMLTQVANRKAEAQLPDFVFLLVVLLFVSVVISFAGEGSSIEILSGIKRTYQLWGLILAIAMAPINERSRQMMSSWLKFIFFMAFLQLPAAIFERLVLVPKRIGMGNGVVPIDIVSGTFESNLEGGGSSSIMVIFLIIILTYVLAAWKDKVIGRGRMVTLTLLLGTPLFLGETKIALVLVPMMFAMVFASEIRRKPFITLFALLIAALLTGLLAWTYLSMMTEGSNTPEKQLQKVIEGNFGSVGYYDRYSLNRTTVMTFWYAKHGLNNPIETVFGHGIGSSYAGAGSLVQGHLNRSYPFMGINLTGLSTLLWDTGLLGTSIFLGALIAAWRASTRLFRQARAGAERAQLVALRVSLASIAFCLLYSNSMFASLSHETIIAVTLGYLAWLVRAEKRASLPQTQKNGHSTSLSYA
jgi:hypothetical protein